MTEYQLTIVRPTQSAPERRSELFWADAFRAIGIETEERTYEGYTKGNKPQFVLGGKPPIPFIRQVVNNNDRIGMWCMDVLDFTPPRWQWAQNACRNLDLAIVNTDPMDHPELYSRLPMRMVLGSTRTPPEYTRPAPVPGTDTIPAVIFTGTYANEDRRKGLQAIMDAGIPTHVYGCGKLPATQHHPPLWGPLLHRLNAQAQIVFCASSRHDRFMTSNRIFQVAAVGGMALALEFPRCRELFPDGAVAWCSLKTAAATADMLMADKELRWRYRSTAREHFRAHHTWEHQAAKVVEFIESEGFKLIRRQDT